MIVVGHRKPDGNYVGKGTNISSNGAGIVPLTQHRDPAESSAAPGRDGIYATDDSMITWWQPAEDDPEPSITVNFEFASGGLDIYSVRIIWRDVGLSIDDNIMAGPFQYAVDAMDENKNWHTVLDMSKNTVDMNIDYLPVEHMKAYAVRLRILGPPENIQPGVTNFTVFGRREH